LVRQKGTEMYNPNGISVQYVRLSHFWPRGLFNLSVFDV